MNMNHTGINVVFGCIGILKCDHSNESYWATLACGTVYYRVQGGSSLDLNSVYEILPQWDHLIGSC